MRIPSWILHVASLSAACLTLAACSSGFSAPLVSSGASSQFGTSWMAPQAKSEDLLYVSDDGNYKVYVYSYPGGQLVGTLDSAYGSPAGMCVDRKGDVFIAEFNANEILEFAHGGSTPIAELHDSGQPLGCSVDRKSGDLAVSNEYGPSGGYGNVEIYAQAQGTPQTYYTNPSEMSGIQLCGYDDKGNLFVDGTNRYNQFRFAELTKGKQFVYMSLSQNINTPGGVLWDGQYVTLGDEGANPAVIYQLSITGSAASVAGTTTLDSTSRVRTYWIPELHSDKTQGTQVIAPSIFGTIGFYDYPSGGSPTMTISQNQPYAAVVSKK
jgi:hypothetical protein